MFSWLSERVYFAFGIDETSNVEAGLVVKTANTYEINGEAK